MTTCFLNNTYVVADAFDQLIDDGWRIVQRKGEGEENMKETLLPGFDHERWIASKRMLSGAPRNEGSRWKCLPLVGRLLTIIDDTTDWRQRVLGLVLPLTILTPMLTRCI